ncbi:hypothetical protein QTN25_004207 [Entamoeba marina]
MSTQHANLKYVSAKSYTPKKKQPQPKIEEDKRQTNAQSKSKIENENQSNNTKYNLNAKQFVPKKKGNQQETKGSKEKNQQNTLKQQEIEKENERKRKEEEEEIERKKKEEEEEIERKRKEEEEEIERKRKEEEENERKRKEEEIERKRKEEEKKKQEEEEEEESYGVDDDEWLEATGGKPTIKSKAKREKDKKKREDEEKKRKRDEEKKKKDDEKRRKREEEKKKLEEEKKKKREEEERKRKEEEERKMKEEEERKRKEEEERKRKEEEEKKIQEEERKRKEEEERKMKEEEEKKRQEEERKRQEEENVNYVPPTKPKNVRNENGKSYSLSRINFPQKMYKGTLERVPSKPIEIRRSLIPIDLTEEEKKAQRMLVILNQLSKETNLEQAADGLSYHIITETDLDTFILEKAKDYFDKLPQPKDVNESMSITEINELKEQEAIEQVEYRGTVNLIANLYIYDLVIELLPITCLEDLSRKPRDVTMDAYIALCSKVGKKLVSTDPNGANYKRIVDVVNLAKTLQSSPDLSKRIKLLLLNVVQMMDHDGKRSPSFPPGNTPVIPATPNIPRGNSSTPDSTTPIPRTPSSGSKHKSSNKQRPQGNVFKPKPTHKFNDK